MGIRLVRVQRMIPAWLPRQPGASELHDDCGLPPIRGWVTLRRSLQTLRRRPIGPGAPVEGSRDRMHVRDGMSSMVLSVGPGHTLRKVAQLMAQRKVGAAV